MAFIANSSLQQVLPDLNRLRIVLRRGNHKESRQKRSRVGCGQVERVAQMKWHKKDTHLMGKSSVSFCSWLEVGDEFLHVLLSSLRIPENYWGGFSLLGRHPPCDDSNKYGSSFAMCLSSYSLSQLKVA